MFGTEKWKGRSLSSRSGQCSGKTDIQCNVTWETCSRQSQQSGERAIQICFFESGKAWHLRHCFSEALTVARLTEKQKEGISLKATAACELMVDSPDADTQLWLEPGGGAPGRIPLSSGDTCNPYEISKWNVLERAVLSLGEGRRCQWRAYGSRTN